MLLKTAIIEFCSADDLILNPENVESAPLPPGNIFYGQIQNAFALKFPAIAASIRFHFGL
jgi:hypothetical protein